jgi:hypothetical protein
MSIYLQHICVRPKPPRMPLYVFYDPRRDDADLPAVAKRVGDHIFRYFPRSAVLLVSADRFVSFPICEVWRDADLIWGAD